MCQKEYQTDQNIEDKGDNYGKICKKRKLIRLGTLSNAHQKIDDHEKLCRIMQMETNKRFLT